MPSSSDAPDATWRPRELDGETVVVPILADPVAQVRSPELFNRFFAHHAINAVVVPAHVSTADFDATLDALARIRNVRGIVITVPHKIRAAQRMAFLTERGRRIGSVNCVRRAADGHWEGDNVDGAGFVRGLRSRGHEPAGRRVLLVGAAGGAGRAVAHALAGEGVARIDLHDVRHEALHAFHAVLVDQYPAVEFRRAAPAAQALHDLIVNASPVGMAASDTVPIALAHARSDAVVADLIMKPARTALLELAAARGHPTHEGKHLLEHSIDEMARYMGLSAD